MLVALLLLLFLASGCKLAIPPLLLCTATGRRRWRGKAGARAGGMMKMRWWRADASEVMAVTAMGVWEAVLAGGGRRFIKRKDSDAGETGPFNSHLHRPLLLPLRFKIFRIISVVLVGLLG